MTTSRTEFRVTPFTHLDRFTDDRGLFEHALLDDPRVEHGYCVDDVARALLVTVREPDPDPRVAALSSIYLDFVDSAITRDGRAHNRMNPEGRWTDEPEVGDWWGRAIWALGTAATHATSQEVRMRACAAFWLAARQRSRHLHASVFAALGAAEMLSLAPRNPFARRLVLGAAAMIPERHGLAWGWPEPRLRYSNGAIPEALIAGGAALRDPAMAFHGLRLLDFLLAQETRDGHLSVTGSEGRAPGEVGPLFDQQPIEVAAIADACACAYDVTGHQRWLAAVKLAWEWFLGNNDSGTPMIDAETGAGFDGLTSGGRNENRGAESTLAALSTFQQARRLLGAGLPV